jgi:hypothetical protein
MATGLISVSRNNPAAPPYKNGPYSWDQNISYGSSGSPIPITSESVKQFAQYVTNSSTSAGTSFEPALFHTTMTGAAQVGGRVRAFMTTNVALGSWSNAFKAEVTYGASGKTAGLGSALVAEMTLSAGTVDGNYAPFEIELNLGSSASIGTKTSLQYMSVNGADASTFDTGGYIMNIQGLTVASGKVFQVNTAADATHALRILIGSTDYFIMLTDSGA